MIFTALLLSSTAVQGLSLCGIVTSACATVVPVAGINGFWQCGGAAAGIAAACEIAGLGPEDPLADLCAVGMSAKFTGSCLASLWGGARFTAGACVSMMMCEWHEDTEPKRTADPKPKPLNQDVALLTAKFLGDHGQCFCHPVHRRCMSTTLFEQAFGLEPDACATAIALKGGDDTCDPANGNADCDPARLLTTLFGFPAAGALPGAGGFTGPFGWFNDDNHDHGAQWPSGIPDPIFDLPEDVIQSIIPDLPDLLPDLPDLGVVNDVGDAATDGAQKVKDWVGSIFGRRRAEPTEVQQHGAAPLPKSPVLGGQGMEEAFPQHREPEEDCMISSDIPERPDELKDEDELKDDRRRFDVGGEHCYCDEWCTSFQDCCPDCFHHHHVSDPCTDQQIGYGEHGCNNPFFCGEPALCAACGYDQWHNRCYTADDPCTTQHGPWGYFSCKIPNYCGAPGFCKFCDYNVALDHCYTPVGGVVPSCSGHWDCQHMTSGCETHSNKDACLFEKMLGGNPGLGTCGQCMNENYGVFGSRDELESHEDSHPEAYCLMWDCAEEFQSCFDAWAGAQANAFLMPGAFALLDDIAHAEEKAILFACAAMQASEWNDEQCKACLKNY